MESKNQNVSITLKDLMTENELNTYKISKHLNELYDSKKRNLCSIGIKISDNTDNPKKVEEKYYKSLIQKHKILSEYLYD